jgi:LPS export ABC transporter protein LptC
MKPQLSDSNFIHRNIKRYGVAALVTGAAMLFYGCENDIQQIKAFYSVEDLPILEATNFETLVTDSGVVRYSLKAPKLLQFENEGQDYVEFPEGMELIQYDKNKNIISSISADYAKQFVADEKWEAKNNVIATNAKGDSLKTEHLIWEEKKELIYTEEFVKIIRADQIITGIGFTSDQNMQNWKIKNPKGTIFVNVKNNENQPATDEPQLPTVKPAENRPQGKLQLNEQ